MTKYTDTISKHRRLTILKFLADSPEYTSNASILEHVCNDSLEAGNTTTRKATLLGSRKAAGAIGGTHHLALI